MPHSLPYHRDHPRKHQRVEETSQHQCRALQVVSVDVDTCHGADDPADSDEQHPVPLPASAHDAPSLLVGEERPAMLVEVDEREDYACGEEDAKHEAGGSLCLDGSDGDVARSCVDEGAVREEQRWGVGLEREDAVAFIREGGVGVKGVIPMFQSGQVEMIGINYGVGSVVPGREWQ